MTELNPLDRAKVEYNRALLAYVRRPSRRAHDNVAAARYTVIGLNGADWLNEPQTWRAAA